ncbi:MAG: DNA topoisomerase 3 [Opitutales bacterium]|nr:DNA topoisomerase 3 [Opitutales bacterium]
MKTLVIAEKPSVASDIAKVLGARQKGDCYENDDYVVSHALGHLVTLADPQDYDANNKRWTYKRLPIIPPGFKLKLIPENKEQYLRLERLIRRPDVDCLVNACDAGREGELIFSYIYQYSKCQKTVKRLWLTSMTASAIADGFKHLKMGEEMKNLLAAARSRAESDWLVGINGTRAITLRIGRGRGDVTTVGRVQTPTLSMLVNRELEIRDFVPENYWRIETKFAVPAGEYSGVYQRSDFKKTDADEKGDKADKADRIRDKAFAEQVLAECNAAGTGIVHDEKTHVTEVCPKLYDLTTLQREANKRFSLSASRTLEIVQALYEKYKATTYPRTDSRALPEDYAPTCKRTLQMLCGNANPTIANCAKMPLEKDWINPFNRRIFNNQEISDHFAIIPTDQVPRGQLSEMEAKVYDMIVRRFIAVFFPLAEFDVTTRTTTVAGKHNFKTEGKVMVVPGWRQVYGRDEKPESSIPAAVEGEVAAIKKIDMHEESTKPPPRYNEATLLGAMESAGKLVDDEELAEAMKERGLGTPATRASIIEHLIKTKYVDRAGKDLVPTIKAEELMSFLKILGFEILNSPAMTGEWEYQLREVSEGRVSREDFMNGIIDLTKNIVAKSNDVLGADTWETTDLISPSDGSPLLENFRMYRSNDEIQGGRGRQIPRLAIYKNVNGHILDKEEVRQLLSKEKIGPFDDFKSRFNRPFTAWLKLVAPAAENEAYKVEFVFPDRKEEGVEEAEKSDEVDFTTLQPIGFCPVTKLPIYSTPNAYETNPADVRGKNLPARPVRLGKILLGTAISEDVCKKMLAGEQTDYMTFVSQKTKRPFEARLKFDRNGRLSFEFKPREAKSVPAGTKKTTRKSVKK